MQDEEAIGMIRIRYTALSPVLDERARRQWAAAEALSYGWGGIRAVSRAISMSPMTIGTGMVELGSAERRWRWWRDA